MRLEPAGPRVSTRGWPGAGMAVGGTVALGVGLGDALGDGGTGVSQPGMSQPGGEGSGLLDGTEDWPAVPVEQPATVLAKPTASRPKNVRRSRDSHGPGTGCTLEDVAGETDVGYTLAVSLPAASCGFRRLGGGWPVEAAVGLVQALPPPGLRNPW